VTEKPTFLDLFCGCGGFTLGMQRAGFRCLAAIDFNGQAVATLRTNQQAEPIMVLPPVGFALEADLTSLDPDTVAAIIGTGKVDVIVGGPPCQGFSTARQRDGANHGERLKDDSRRQLYREFLRYVGCFRPKVFVMENVLGIRTAAGGAFFTAVKKEARALGYRVHGQIEDAFALGVPQKRRRQFIIGSRLDVPGYFPSKLTPAPRATAATMLGDAICDLPPLKAGEGEYRRNYDFSRRGVFLSSNRQRIRRRYLFEVLEVEKAEKLTSHFARPHSDRDLSDFARLRPGESSATAMKRGVRFKHPYDKSTFKDRYTKQHFSRPCSTIVAHLSKDGLMFIHPRQERSLTPREAARVQSFPDWFRFPESQTHAFRLIGNAVPPLVAEAVGLAIKGYLNRESPPAPATAVFPDRKRDGSVLAVQQPVLSNPERQQVDMHCVRPSFVTRSKPVETTEQFSRSQTAAASALERLAKLDRRSLRALSTGEFLLGWQALLFLFPGLHPENALDHGANEEPWPEAQLVFPGLEEAMRRRYVRSGWPVALELIGREAWRRFDAGGISHDQFYNAEAYRVVLKSAICQTQH
jgi:DNA (cytosine-5)-methyltransferase 1